MVLVYKLTLKFLLFFQHKIKQQQQQEQVGIRLSYPMEEEATFTADM
jgi:hypothetical protein